MPQIRYLPSVTITLFIATSLDGYIAGPDDDLSWLFTDADYGFSEFYETVDGLIMGRGTYDVVRKMGKWPYPGKPTYVVSKNTDFSVDTPDTKAATGELEDLEVELVDLGLKNVWLVGGGELVRSFLDQQRIDRIVISLHPVLLGRGVALFSGGFPGMRLKLEHAESFDSGLVQLTYLTD